MSLAIQGSFTILELSNMVEAIHAALGGADATAEQLSADDFASLRAQATEPPGTITQKH